MHSKFSSFFWESRTDIIYLKKLLSPKENYRSQSITGGWWKDGDTKRPSFSKIKLNLIKYQIKSFICWFPTIQNRNQCRTIKKTPWAEKSLESKQNYVKYHWPSLSHENRWKAINHFSSVTKRKIQEDGRQDGRLEAKNNIQISSKKFITPWLWLLKDNQPTLWAALLKFSIQTLRLVDAITWNTNHTYALYLHILISYPYQLSKRKAQRCLLVLIW